MRRISTRRTIASNGLGMLTALAMGMLTSCSEENDTGGNGLGPSGSSGSASGSGAHSGFQPAPPGGSGPALTPTPITSAGPSQGNTPVPSPGETPAVNTPVGVQPTPTPTPSATPTPFTPPPFISPPFTPPQGTPTPQNGTGGTPGLPTGTPNTGGGGVSNGGSAGTEGSPSNTGGTSNAGNAGLPVTAGSGGETPVPTPEPTSEPTVEPTPEPTAEPGPQPPSSDPTTWGGEPRCYDFVLCETFEVSSGLPAGWALQGYGTRTVEIATDQARRGTQALRIDVPAGQGAVVAMLQHAAPAELTATHWGRVFVRIQSPMVPQFVHYDLFAALGPYTTYTNEVRWAVTGTGLGTQANNQSFIYNVQPSGNGAPGEFGTEGPRSAKPVVDEWMCLEWFFSAEPQEARFFYMGEEQEYLHIDTERSEIPVFNNFRVGFQKFQNSDSFRVWVDEAAFHTSRIGCNN